MVGVAVNVTDPPVQIEVLDAITETDGTSDGVTVTVPIPGKLAQAPNVYTSV